MTDLASYCEAREKVDLKVDRQSGKLTISVASKLDNSRYGTPEITLLIPERCKPNSAMVELPGGEWKSATMHAAVDSRQTVVEIPSTARTLQITPDN